MTEWHIIIVWRKIKISCRYEFRVQGEKEGFLGITRLEKNKIKRFKEFEETISLQHYYDTKEPKRNVKYEVVDNKTNKVIYKEGDLYVLINKS